MAMSQPGSTAIRQIPQFPLILRIPQSPLIPAILHRLPIQNPPANRSKLPLALGKQFH